MKKLRVQSALMLLLMGSLAGCLSGGEPLPKAEILLMVEPYEEAPAYIELRPSDLTLDARVHKLYDVLERADGAAAAVETTEADLIYVFRWIESRFEAEHGGNVSGMRYISYQGHRYIVFGSVS